MAFILEIIECFIITKTNPKPIQNQSKIIQQTNPEQNQN